MLATATSGQSNLMYFLMQIDLDNEENDGDKPTKQDRKANKHKAAPESDSDLDLEFIPVIKRYAHPCLQLIPKWSSSGCLCTSLSLRKYSLQHEHSSHPT